MFTGKDDGLFEDETVAKYCGIATLVFFRSDEIDMFVAFGIECRKIVGIEKVHRVFSKKELSRSGEHGKAIAGYVLVDQNEILI